VPSLVPLSFERSFGFHYVLHFLGRLPLYIGKGENGSKVNEMLKLSVK
jgi:hypothetical protein